jgi:uncharacterized membrane protein
MRTLLFAAALLAPPAIAAQAGFVALDAPGSQLVALSADGRVAAGTLSGAASGGFRWREGRGLELLPGAVSVHGLSPSGRSVAGSAFDAARRETAAYWDDAGTRHALGGLPGALTQSGLLSLAFGVSDEPRVVGVANGADDRLQAFVWTAADGLRALTLPDAARSARARGLSADGRRIYGGYERADGRYAGVLWNDGRAQPLADGAGRFVGEVLGADRDGRVLIGSSETRDLAFVYRWNASGGIETLQRPATPLPLPLHAYAGSEDGRLVVGSAGLGAERIAVIWNAAEAPQPFAAWLAQRGVDVPAQWTLAEATAISADGRRVGGWGRHDGQLDSFVVDLPAAAPADTAKNAAP